MLIFTEYRDTVDHLVESLTAIPGIQVDKFIGQSGKGKRKGMTQRQQLAQLNRFRDGELNVLVATSVGEEGLDVPAADLVILYEPVASAIRAIQRRGRTARQRDGSVHTLIAVGSRDEYVNTAAERREAKMYTLLQRIHDRGRLPRRPPPPADVLGAFSIQDEGITLAPQEFIQQETEKYAPEEAKESPSSQSIEKDEPKVKREPPTLHPVDRRPRQQMGLDQFMSSVPSPAPTKKSTQFSRLNPKPRFPDRCWMALLTGKESNSQLQRPQQASLNCKVMPDKHPSSSTIGSQNQRWDPTSKAWERA